MIVGRIIIPSRTQAASILVPVPPKICLIRGTMRIRPKKPYTIDGMPARSSIAGFMTPWALPVAIFVAFSITEYLVTFNWTLYLLAMPSVVGLAAVVGCNPYLAIAALVCAGVFGSNASFSSDNGVLVASACKIDLYEQNISQLPYMAISVVLSAVAFLAAGIVCA